MSRDRLTRLVAIMPPPRTPTLPPGPDDWPSVERELGIGLPSDYKAFLATYGSGEINGLIDVASPSFGMIRVRLSGFIHECLATLRAQRDAGMPGCYPIYPEPGGVLPWGGSGNGDLYCWKTEPPDDPDRWPVVVHGRDSGEWVEHPGPLTGYLVDLLEQRIEMPGRRVYFEDHPPEFVPFDPVFDGLEPEATAWKWPRPTIDPVGFALYPDRDGMTGVETYLGRRTHPDRIRAVFKNAEIPAPEELVELYSWHDGMNQERWGRLQLMRAEAGRPIASGPIPFLPGVMYPDLEESLAKYEALCDTTPGWRTDWFPVFTTQAGMFAVECAGDGAVWLVPREGEETADVRFPSLSALLKLAASRFEGGAWDWLDEEWRFRADPGSELDQP